MCRCERTRMPDETATRTVFDPIALGREEVRFGGALLGHRERRRASRVPFAVLRLSSIQKVIDSRYAGPCPSPDADRYLRAAAPYILVVGRITLRSWARRWTPLLAHPESQQFFDRIAEEASSLRRWPTADQLACHLGVTNAERLRLGLQTIGAIDRPKRQREADRRAADKAYQRAKRLEQGATPRERSLKATKPWEAHGISERHWRRQVKAGKIPRHPSSLDVRDPSAPTILLYGVADESRTSAQLDHLSPAKENDGLERAPGNPP
jgi:hypothetical protein